MLFLFAVDAAVMSWLPTPSLKFLDGLDCAYKHMQPQLSLKKTKARYVLYMSYTVQMNVHAYAK